ncbi:bifunctional sterol desaturase/short chain dehydrogenase [Altericista sp. CCNU0014]|uniref:bifunctional sterol desaturase/short chain dehydrogenase n=1 Tax=Altericista sp. CCNU0014 TaxID=3082949 RepID=UPI00384EEE8C
MDVNLLPSELFIQAFLGLGSVLAAEVIRDGYHLAGHYWQPLQGFHNLHHKAYRRDLSMTSLEAYKKAQWSNDVPEAIAMVALTAAIAGLAQTCGLWLGMWAGCLYSLGFLIPAIARSQGFLLQTDLTHKPGDLVEIPSQWSVNRTYHWRHHFDQGNAYFCSTVPLVDKVLGTCLSLKGKVVGVTGASGALGQALVEELSAQGARVVAISTNADVRFKSGVDVLYWQIGGEAQLKASLEGMDILILNHGTNVYGDRSYAAVQKSFEVNAFSTLKLAELFLETVTKSSHRAIKELWVNTSEAEVNPAFSPLYELSKRTLGDLVTLRRLDAPCIIRKLVLGPFKSQLNPYGVMSARWVAWAIVALAKRDFRDVIVTINPITYIAFPLKELYQSLYFKLCTRKSKHQV